jgi:hypothetical protein
MGRRALRKVRFIRQLNVLICLPVLKNILALPIGLWYSTQSVLSTKEGAGHLSEIHAGLYNAQRIV